MHSEGIIDAELVVLAENSNIIITSQFWIMIHKIESSFIKRNTSHHPFIFTIIIHQWRKEWWYQRLCHFTRTCTLISESIEIAFHINELNNTPLFNLTFVCSMFNFIVQCCSTSIVHRSTKVHAFKSVTCIKKCYHSCIT